jgi:fumarylacetoacetate (FAA) hydrolase family protein
MLSLLPDDWDKAVLLGRVDFGDGPTPVAVRGGRLADLSSVAPTVSLLLDDPGQIGAGRDLGPLADFDFAPDWIRRGPPRLLSPLDLHCIKAAGVTFALSTMERVIEERALGDPAKAQSIRDALETRIGANLRQCRPGSEQAAALKAALIADGLWSPYLEVAIGPDAEIFTKSAPLSSVGWGAQIGIRASSRWNNPEPEIVLVCNRHGQAVGAALGNDVNLRDIEGRSALLLGMAKDANASCSVGPFIRLFDAHFTLDDIRSASVALEVKGADNYVLTGENVMAQISRDPIDLMRQTLLEHHYPDGFALFLGTMFAPVQDRGVTGQGFTHKDGDLVTIASPRLGALQNRVTACSKAPPWDFGIADLMRNLAERRLLSGPRKTSAT